MRRLSTTVLTLALLLGVAACSSSSDDAGGSTTSPASSTSDGGGSSPSSPGSTPKTACELLPPERAATALADAGEPTPESNTIGEVTVTTCTYTGAEGTISLLVRHQPGQGSFVASSIDTLKTVTFEGQATQDVPDLGDGALFSPSSGGQLNVFSGDDLLVFTGGTLASLRPLAVAALAA